MGSKKLKSGVDKGDVREKKKKKTIMKHERGIVILLTFEFESRLIDYSFNL